MNRFRWGFALGLFLCLGSALLSAQGNKTRIRVIVENATIRANPDLGSEIIESDISLGTVYEAEKKVGDWFEVKYRSRLGATITGYIHSMYVEVITDIQPPPRKEVQEIPAPKAEPAYPAAPAPGRPGFMSLRLEGGLGLVNPSDLNDVIAGREDYWSEEGDFFNWKQLKLMNEFGAELAINFTDNIGIGLGAAYLSKNVAGEYGSEYSSYNREYKLSVIPLTGSLYIRFPMSGVMDFYLLGGAGYYLASLKHDYRSQGGSSSDTINEEVTCNSLGFHAGAGLEIYMSPSIAFVLNGVYRMVNFTEWHGNRDATEGDLYYYQSYSNYYGRNFPSMWVYANAPSSSSISNVRLAEINLSGIVFKLGFLFRF